MCEWATDYTTPERIALTGILSQRGGSSAMWADYTMAQVTAGLVPVPDFLRKAVGPQR
jgi:hypothetical protein